MNYLVTGGTGFIGAHIVRLLNNDGENVTAYDASPNRNLLEKLIGRHKSDHVVVIQGDITDAAHLTQTCRQHNIERIIHTAAIIGSEEPAVTVHVNCDGTINVLDVSRHLGIKRVVLSSSISVYGPPDRYKEEYIPNDAPHYPKNIYTATKTFNESCAHHYFREYDLDVIAIRLAHVYGFGRTRMGVGRTIDEELFIKPTLGTPGRVPFGDGIHNFMYIEDAARVMVMASRVETTRTRSFTADGDIVSTAQAAAHVKRLVPDAEITLLPGSVGWAYKFDTTPIREEIGYRPEWTIEKGVQDFISQIRKFDSMDNK
jgi:UDP-glucose 4-epimerase